MITVILLNWNRPTNVIHLAQKYSQLEIVSNVICFDNRGSLKDWTDLTDNIVLIRSSKDMGLYTRFAAASLAQTDAILHTDDDVELSEKTIESLYARWTEQPSRCHGLHGRHVNGGYDATNCYGAVEVVLTRALICSRATNDLALSKTLLFRDLAGQPSGNGEDIILSYAAMSRSGELNHAYDFEYLELGGNEFEGIGNPDTAIHLRWPEHVSHRSAIANRCRQVFAIAPITERRSGEKSNAGSVIRATTDWIAGFGIDLRPMMRRVRQYLFPSPPIPALVSIIMPTYNRSALIERAVTSVLRQSYLNWELILVDDGSTDKTALILRPYLSHRRIRYLVRPHGNVSKARNTGLRHAAGEFIAYLDSDNAWSNDYLASMITAFDDVNTQSAYGILLRHEENGEIQKQFTDFDRASLLSANFIDINVFVHRQKLFLKYGGFDERLKRLSDWDLILRYTEESAPKKVKVEGAHYYADADFRISTTESFSEAYQIIQQKWRTDQRQSN